MNIDNYIDELIKYQNTGVNKLQKHLFSKKQYYEIVKPVVELLKKHPDYSMTEYRKKLFEEFKIEEKVLDFVNNKDLSAGVIFTYGTANYQETVIYGNSNEVSFGANNELYEDKKSMNFDDIFDIASMTKPYMAYSLLILSSKGEINLNDEVIKYVPYFKNLHGVTIHDLLAFNVPVITNGRIDNASSKEEAEKILFDTKINKNFTGLNSYTDIGIMILKYVVEAVSGKKYYDFIKENILDKAGMSDTHVSLPNNKIDRLISSNYDIKYYNDGNVVRTNNSIGSVYDPKAIILGGNDGNLIGHAGLFSTLKDFEKLSRSLISGNIIEFEAFKQMFKNRTGSAVTNDEIIKYTNFLGYACYSKHPLKSETELHHSLSGMSYSSAGWTGGNYTLDYLNKINFTFFAPKSHNRATFIDPSKREFVSENEFGKKTLTLPDGSTITDSTKFAWDKGDIINASTELVLAYKVLEDIVSYQKEVVDENYISLGK